MPRKTQWNSRRESTVVLRKSGQSVKIVCNSWISRKMPEKGRKEAEGESPITGARGLGGAELRAVEASLPLTRVR